MRRLSILTRCGLLENSPGSAVRKATTEARELSVGGAGTTSEGSEVSIAEGARKPSPGSADPNIIGMENQGITRRGSEDIIGWGRGSNAKWKGTSHKEPNHRHQNQQPERFQLGNTRQLGQLRRLTHCANVPIPDETHIHEPTARVEYAIIANNSNQGSSSKGEIVIPATFRKARNLTEVHKWRAAANKRTGSLR